MKYLFCLLILISATAAASDLKFSHRLTTGARGNVGDALKDGKRLIYVWPPGEGADYDEEPPKNESQELREARLEPYNTFKDKAHDMYGKFTALEDSFNACAEKKKWPESKECLKLFQYCFGKEQSGCDAGRDNNRSKRCGVMKLGECLEKSEAQFHFLKNCFSKDNDLGFSFIPGNANDEWEKLAGVRATGSEGRESWSCDFTYMDGKFNLIRISPAMSFWERIGVPLTRDVINKLNKK